MEYSSPGRFARARAPRGGGVIGGRAGDHGVPAPGAQGVRGVLDAAVASGLGERDWSDLVEHIDRQAGVRLAYAAPDPT